MTAVKRQLRSLPEGAGRPVHVAQQLGRLMQHIRDTFAAEDWGGLRQSHFRLMSCVPPRGITISDLAEPLGMTKQAVGQFVTQLTASGHLDVRSDPADRRTKVVVLTPLGARTYRAVGARIARIERQWARRVGQEDYAEFRRVLDALVDRV